MNATQRTFLTALWLKQRVEHLAKDLHRHYRAGEKALGLHGWCAHDHGWDACSNQRYFRQRAARELRGKL